MMRKPTIPSRNKEHSNPKAELESPFLGEEFFVEEHKSEWKAHLAALHSESLFQGVFDQALPPADAVDMETPKLFENKFVSEEPGIIKGDDRVRIRDTTGVPWRWICKIIIEDNRRRPVGHGTGVLVSDRHILTAAHVVYDAYKNMHQYTVTVIPALNDLREPFGRYSIAKKPKIRREYNPDVEGHLDWDYALLTLTEAIGKKNFRALKGSSLCYWGSSQCGANSVFARPDPGTLNGKAVYTAGYPGGKGGKQLWCASGILHSVYEQRRTMWITADTTGGQSGSPVWVIDNKRYCLVGIAVGTRRAAASNTVVRVTREFIRQVRTWITEDGDTPSMKVEKELFEPSEIEFGEDKEGMAIDDEIHKDRVSVEEDYYDEESSLTQAKGHVSEEMAGGSSFEDAVYLVEEPHPPIEEVSGEAEDKGAIDTLEDGEHKAEDLTVGEKTLIEHDKEAKPLLFDEHTGVENEVFVEEELNTAGVNRAVRLNTHYARKLGWERYRDHIENYLMASKYWITSMWPESDFPKAVARWQKKQGLKPDGIIGPKSWNRMKVMACVGYEPGEITKSHTQAGHLKRDVFMTRGGWLVIADFGIGRNEIKASTRREKLLKEWLENFETDPPDEILIIGFSDCVGKENNNEVLRRSRAMEVAKLFGPRARANMRVFSGKMGRYLADDNLTSINRAKNRSVLIQWKRDFVFRPEDVPGKALSLEDIIRDSLQALDREKELGLQLSPEKIKQIKCSLNTILDPQADDRYISRAKWLNRRSYLRKRVTPEFLEKNYTSQFREGVRRLYRMHRDQPRDKFHKFMVEGLELMDDDVVQAINYANFLRENRDRTMDPGDRQILDWITSKMKRSAGDNIYKCHI